MRIHHRPTVLRRLGATAGAVLALVATAIVAGETPAAAFNKATDPVIFVRGWVGPNSCGDDVRGYFNNPQHANPPQTNTIEKTIRSYGWNGPFHYVGYYECDSNLTSGPFGFDWINRYNEVGHNWELPGWQAGEGNNGDISNCWKQTAFGRLATQDCSINNLAYHLAWYIYRNFSQNGQSVHLIGHSMGGLIIRSALFERPRQAVFPPTLLVESAVTVATPHDGIAVPITTSVQLRQMQPDSPYLTSLNTVLGPRGNNGTNWLVIGSWSDDLVSGASATNMCCGGVYKVVYEEPDGPGHTNYFDDKWVARIGPNRAACWSLGTQGFPTNATEAADNIGPMIERGLSSVWQSPPAASRLC
jgi:hypothetical protein